MGDPQRPTLVSTLPASLPIPTHPLTPQFQYFFTIFLGCFGMQVWHLLACYESFHLFFFVHPPEELLSAESQQRGNLTKSKILLDLPEI